MVVATPAVVQTMNFRRRKLMVTVHLLKTEDIMAQAVCSCRACQLPSSTSVPERAASLLRDLINQTANEKDRARLEEQLERLAARHELKSAA